MVSTRVRVRRTLASLLGACLCVPAAAQAVHEDQRVRLVSPAEGEMIVQAAWELRKGLHPKPDCSHFVHAVYDHAGLDYEYAKASDIYDGIDSFQRVFRPQTGDLVVWRSHVGIVVDSEEHLFYSSVLSGFAIEDYRSDYWVSRGRPRFFRYGIEAMQAVAALHPSSRSGKQAHAQPVRPARPLLLP